MLQSSRFARRLNEAIDEYRKNELKSSERRLQQNLPASPIFFPRGIGGGGYTMIRAEDRDGHLFIVTRPWNDAPMKPGQIFAEFEITDEETARDEIRSIVETYAMTGEEVEEMMYY